VGLSDGKALIFGGEERSGTTSDAVDEFDPTTRR
jgi:hypothetical protein